MNAQTSAPCLPTALDCAARGWRVFPAPRGEKKSHKKAEFSGGRNWGATTDPDEIRRDFTRWPDANLGIATGPDSGVFVLDLDVKNGADGVSWLAERIAEMGEWPDTIEAQSPSGSWHVYFAYPAAFDVRTCEGLIAPGVDVRGHGGMVIAPPSVKPGADLPYRWKNPPGLFDVADAPQWVLDLLPRREDETKRQRDTGDRKQERASGFGFDAGPIGKTIEDYRRLAQGCWTDGQKHYATRDLAASLAGQGVSERCATGIILALVPLHAHDANLLNSIRTGFAKFRRDKGAEQTAQADDSDEIAPVDLWGTFAPPAFPRGVLPPVIEAFAVDEGEAMGADPAGLAAAALCVCAAALPDAIKLQVKEHRGGWLESARLWVALVGDPSTKKSPIIAAAERPLARIDRKLFKQYRSEMDRYLRLPPDERKEAEPPRHVRKRLEDTTPEAAAEVLEHSRDGLLCTQDELSGWFGSMDRYAGARGGAKDRAFWLQAFNGGSFSVTRIKRGAFLVDNLSICLLGGIQPDPIRRAAADTVDDGLIQRLCPIVLRPAKMGTDAPGEDAAHAYEAALDSLYRMQPPQLGSGRIAGDMTEPLRLDAGAQEVRRRLEARHLEIIAAGLLNRKLAAHIGKMDGIFARLCVLFHCLDHVGAGRPPATIPQDTAERVARFMHRFLLPHAVAFYGGVLDLSDDHDRLQAIAGYILAQRLEIVKPRDVQAGVRTMRKLERRDTTGALEQLEALGWLLPQSPAQRANAAPVWRVNPAVHRLFAERSDAERERREKARRAIEELGRCTTQK